MPNHINGRYTGGTESLDGNTYRSCAFTGCHLVYEGGVPPIFDKCEFHECRFELSGAAANTVAFLKATAAPGSGMQQVVRETFKGVNLN
jgi:hypothetical protein